MIGISLRAYQWYESGKRIPPPEILDKIAYVHQVPVDYLAKGSFSFYDFFYEGKSNKKKLKNRREAELLTANLLPLVERFPRMFDQFKTILEDNDWKKREALRATLHAMAPAKIITPKNDR